jgi:hypothetical protein
MKKDKRIEEYVSKKVIEVKSPDNPDPPLPSSSSLSQGIPELKNPIPSNSFDVINDWEQIHGKTIRGKLRDVSEYVAKQNLSKKLPTNKEIKVHLGISKEYCKKILTKARRIGLLAIHQKRSGHQYRYYVTNIQDHMILEDDVSKSEESEEGEIDLEKDLLLPLAILDDLMERENVSFHHINLKSKLRDISDYDRINWSIASNSNKGKIFELKISQYRSCEFIVYPKGTVSMIIKCSNDPLYLTTFDVADFFSICGEIIGVLKAETSNSEPLIDDVADWKITQIDAAFDIPFAAPEDTDQTKKSNMQKGLLSYSNFGTFRLKYLGQFYQMYSKNVLHKGKILRIERRFSFLDMQPTVTMTLDKVEKGMATK